MPNFDGTGPRGRGRLAVSARGICRRSSEGRSGQASGRPGSRLSGLLWLVREVLSIWGVVKALQGTTAGPSRFVTEHDSIKRENQQRLKKTADRENRGESLAMQTPACLIEHRQAGGSMMAEQAGRKCSLYAQEKRGSIF